MTADADGQLGLPFGSRTVLDRQNFHVAPCNSAALSWLERWPDWPGPVVVLTGPPGSGKTHLAHIFRDVSDGRFLHPREISPLLERGGETEAPAWIIDDADAGLDPIIETALFHLYNRLFETRGYLLMTACRAASRWSIVLPDLASRLRAAPTVSISAPDEEMLSGVLIKMFADRQIRVAPEVVTYLVSRMERSFQTARRLVDSLDSLSLREKRAITVPLARRVLEEI